MNKPHLIRDLQIPPIKIQKRERYLPTAFDESLSILERINKVIHYLNEYSDLTEEMLQNWNEVYRWVMNEGLDDTVSSRLREWLDDGTFHRIINEDIFNELNSKISNIEKEFEFFKSDISELNEKISSINEEIFWVGRVNIVRGEV